MAPAGARRVLVPPRSAVMTGIGHCRMRRARADKLLSAVIDVAGDINADTAMAHYIRRLSVFGGYLGDGAVLTSLSLAYDLGARQRPDPRNAALIVRCLKLRQGITLTPHSELDAARHPHRVVFESA